MPPETLTRYLLLPELRLLKIERADFGGVSFFAEKTSAFEVCPRCATLSRSVYDHRWVKLRDDPIRDQTFICTCPERQRSFPSAASCGPRSTTSRRRKKVCGH